MPPSPISSTFFFPQSPLHFITNQLCPTDVSRKKQTKMISLHNTNPNQPDPAAFPCTECGKGFRSCKALFGHMRCHPERSWRGINPPPNLHRPTQDDHYAATCLLMLAKGPGLHNTVGIQMEDVKSNKVSHKNVKGCFALTRHDHEEGELVGDCGHRCSVCSRTFSSGQALGGHKRCHWEKEDALVPLLSQPCRFDLNLPAPLQQDDSTSSTSDLDLRLGL